MMEVKQSIPNIGLPKKQGLYDPKFEKDNCGIGFIASIKGEKSHEIVQKGLMILQNLSHRGATGCDETTGDGAGIMIQIPHEFFKKKCEELNIDLPGEGEYAVGMMFLPRESDEDLECERSTHPQSGQHYLRQCAGFIWNPVSGASVCAGIDL